MKSKKIPFYHCRKFLFSLGQWCCLTLEIISIIVVCQIINLPTQRLKQNKILISGGVRQRLDVPHLQVDVVNSPPHDNPERHVQRKRRWGRHLLLVLRVQKAPLHKILSRDRRRLPWSRPRPSRDRHQERRWPLDVSAHSSTAPGHRKDKVHSWLDRWSVLWHGPTGAQVSLTTPRPAARGSRRRMEASCAMRAWNVWRLQDDPVQLPLDVL